MKDFYINNTSQNSSNVYCSSIPVYHDSNDATFIHGVECMIIGIGLLLTLVAIPALYSLVRNDHVAPIYVINLLISDLLQFCCMIADVAQPDGLKIFYYIYLYSLTASVCFMVGISLERYLVIVFPVWYRCRRTIKTSVVICVLAWALSVLHPIAQCFSFNVIIKTIDIVFLFLPLPPLIFFLVETLKALSASISLQAVEKRRIVGTLVLVLLIYMLLVLPNSILTVLYRLNVYTSSVLVKLAHVFVRLSPLADLVLYIFMKKGAVDKHLASVCCCRMEINDVSIPV